MNKKIKRLLRLPGIAEVKFDVDRSDDPDIYVATAATDSGVDYCGYGDNPKEALADLCNLSELYETEETQDD